MFIAHRGVVKEADVILSRDVSFTKNDEWISLSSTPNIHELFKKFNTLFFCERLKGVKLEWSNKMTKSAGLCYSYSKRRYSCIRLSKPLLSQRPHSDLVETLLHEMIHAYLNVTGIRDDGDHGTKFHEHMHRINKAVGTNISVYHTFHAEVNSLKKHWWRCDGPCRKRPPFFGWIKRAINKAPGPWDSWWRSHSYNCGGRFVKVKEPLEYTKKRVKGLFGYEETSPDSRLVLNDFGFEFMPCGNTTVNQNNNVFSPHSKFVPTDEKTIKNKLVECPICVTKVYLENLPDHLKVCNVLQSMFNENVSGEQSSGIDFVAQSKSVPNVEKTIDNELVECPICVERISLKNLSEHLKGCNVLQSMFSEDDLGEKNDTVELASQSIYIPTEEKPIKTELVECPVCDKRVSLENLPEHLKICNDLQSMFDENTSDGKNSSAEFAPQSKFVLTDEKTLKTELVECPICVKRVLLGNLPGHLKGCNVLQSIFSEDCLDEKSSRVKFASQSNSVLPEEKNITTELVDCPVCSKRVPLGNVSDHLKGCNVLQSIFSEDCLDKKSSRVKFGSQSNSVLPKEKNITTELVDCPVCSKRVPLGNVSDHLKGCNVLQSSFNDDSSDDENSEDCQRNEDIIHVIDEENSNQMDLGCPISSSEVQGYLSSPISRCLIKEISSLNDKHDNGFKITEDRSIGKGLVEKSFSNSSVDVNSEKFDDNTQMFVEDIVDLEKNCEEKICKGESTLHYNSYRTEFPSKVYDKNGFKTGKKEDEKVRTCLVCEKVLPVDISLRDHLEVCDSLEGIFEDDVVIIDDNCDSEHSDDCKPIQYCNYCDLEVADSTDHLSSCFSFYEELHSNVNPPPSLSQINSTEESYRVNPTESVLSCPICGLEVRSNMNSHVENDCLSTVADSEEFSPPLSTDNFSSPTRNRSVVVDTVENNQLISSLPRSDDQSSKPFFAIKNVNMNKNSTSNKEFKEPTLPLVFCRVCLKFYSVSYCPVCCKKK